MDDPDDFFDLFRRFQTMEQAVRIGLIERASRPTGLLDDALHDTCTEAVCVAERALRLGAEADLWSVLVPAGALWARLAELLQSCGDAGLTLTEPIAQVVALADHLLALQVARESLDRHLLDLQRWPTDRCADGAVVVTIQELLRAADQLTVEALDVPGTVRLDVAIAVLTAVAAWAARATRERGRLRDEHR